MTKDGQLPETCSRRVEQEAMIITQGLAPAYFPLRRHSGAVGSFNKMSKNEHSVSPSADTITDESLRKDLEHFNIIAKQLSKRFERVEDLVDDQDEVLKWLREDLGIIHPPYDRPHTRDIAQLAYQMAGLSRGVFQLEDIEAFKQITNKVNVLNNQLNLLRDTMYDRIDDFKIPETALKLMTDSKPFMDLLEIAQNHNNILHTHSNQLLAVEDKQCVLDTRTTVLSEKQLANEDARDVSVKEVKDLFARLVLFLVGAFGGMQYQVIAESLRDLFGLGKKEERAHEDSTADSPAV